MSEISHIKRTNSIEQVRYGCAIGALATVSAIPGAMPITHCGPGCTAKQSGVLMGNGAQGGGYSAGPVIPSVNSTEKEVVFGGEKKLRELIKSSLVVIKADLFVVLNGCIGELVGDDVESVVREFQDLGFPIVHADTGGFKGNNLIGHEIVTKAIIDQYVGDYHGEKQQGLINVWSEVPYQDTFWRGDLEEIKRILEGSGFKVNILFGPESEGVSEWKRIPQAQFNLVISPWVGLKTAKYLEKKYNQPYLHIPIIPIGAKETSNFLRKVADFAGSNKDEVENFIKKEEKRYYYYLDSFSEFYAEYGWSVTSLYAVISDSAYGLAINRFLADQMGLVPVIQVITDNPPEKYRNLINEQFENISDDISSKVEYAEDGYTIDKIVRQQDFGSRAPIIFGTAWDRDLAKELNGYIMEISLPVSNEIVIDRSYVGYRGALTLLERLYTIVTATDSKIITS
ncbi:MAG: nitrogenase component 1 [Clostridium sp.]